MTEIKDLSEAKAVELWQKKISKAEKFYEPYHNLIEEIRGYYRNEKKNNKHSLFWSSIETLKPFLYFKQPRPYVARHEKNVNPVEATACKILEKALAWDLEQFDFDSMIKYVRDDFLLSGMGIAEEKYKAEFEEIANPEDESQLIEVKKSEKVVTDYIDPKDFIADSEQVGIWEKANWVGIKIHMTKQQVIDAFGEEVKEWIVEPGETDYQTKDTVVYKIWDKEESKILWLSKEVKFKFLKVIEDTLNIQGFLPIPKPIYATQTNDSLLPVPDYSQIKPILNELDGINTRMQLVMQSLKVSGAYDKSFPELKNILNKDVTLVGVSDFNKLKEAGGISGIMDFAPIQQYIDALSTLSQRRVELQSELFEITGVSDIMRGNSDPNETATAVKQKTNFGSLRNQDRQNDMQRFITDLLKIKAEIICEHFSEEFLAQFAGAVDQVILAQAIDLLRTEKLRGMVLGIETDTAFNQDAEAQKALEVVKMINDMMQTAVQAIMTQPPLLPLYKQMVLSLVVTLPNARQFEATIDQTFNQWQQLLAQPKQEKPDPALIVAQNQAQKNQQDFAIKQEQNQLKAKELADKNQIEREKLAQTNQEMVMEYNLKETQLAQQAVNDTVRNVNANISTGYHKGF